MSTHALLLRLLISPYFSVSVALNYLSAYSDSIGITYYLTRRLRELETSELQDVWGFICHLLISRPSKSRALECFVVEISQRSTHIAMLTLWFMQAALHDLSTTRTDSPSFIICQRTLHQCHEIIFGDLPPPASTPYSSLSAPFASRFKRKVKHHAEPAIVGIGAMLAGVPGMPKITEIIGEVAIQQGRMEVDGERGLTSIETMGDDDDGQVQSMTASPVEDERGSSSIPAARNAPMTRRNTITAAQTTPALPLHLRTHRKPRLSDDPLGQLDADTSSQTPSPFQSTPSLSGRPVLRSRDTGEGLLQRYDTPSQIHMLRSHYCRNEVQFLLSLENICNRLLVVPRPARVSALRAELTALNHKLPAEVCMPMWCSSSDATTSAQSIPRAHHRIVRIPPGESVVLNSAERAPYLLLIEVLGEDLDFDPVKRGNKEILKKMMLKGQSRDANPFNSSPTVQFNPTHKENSSDADVVPSTGLPVSSVQVIPATPTAAESNLADDEEIDLVEQLYGTEQSLRSTDISDSIVLPPKPKNRELDMMTWSRSNSVPPSPAIEARTDVISAAPSPSPLIPNENFELEGTSKTITLDDYSERMRAAAVMLAQLNANQIREQVGPGAAQRPSHPPEMQTGALGWLPGSNWLANQPTPAEAAEGKGPLHPSLASGKIDAPNAPPRMKLSHVDAAAIRDRIMKEMLSLEEERMQRMKESRENAMRASGTMGNKSAEDESIIRRELEKADPSALVFNESWTVKKSRIRNGSPYGHLANWDCVSVIVKTGGDLRQEQLAVQLIREFQQIWREENCPCWLKYFRILITGGTSGLVETISDAVSIHSIKKAEYARRLATGRLGTVTLMDHFRTTYGDPSSAKFARAQRNFAKSLAGYSVVSYLLQIKDRHNGNILLDRDGNIGFEAAPFKLSSEYIEVLGGVQSAPFQEFRRLFREGFEVARKHCDRVITLVELMQRDSSLPCFAAFGEQTASQLRERFQPALTHSLVGEYVDRLIDTYLNSNWTRLYDSYQYYSQSIL